MRVIRQNTPAVPTWDEQLQEILQQLFPEQDLTDPEVVEARDYLNDCVDMGKVIGFTFYKYFPRIRSEQIDQALQAGKTMQEIIVRSAEVQSTKEQHRELQRDVRDLPLVRRKYGQGHRGGGGVHAS